MKGTAFTTMIHKDRCLKNVRHYMYDMSIYIVKSIVYILYYGDVSRETRDKIRNISLNFLLILLIDHITFKWIAVE